MRENKKRSLLIFTGLFLIVLSFVAAYFAYLILWSENTTYKVNPPSSAISKLKYAEEGNGTARLDEADINGLMQYWTENRLNQKSVNIKKLYVKISKDTISIYAPAKYAGFDILLNSNGKLVDEGDRIVFKPISFKVGRMPISKKYAMNKFKSFSNSNIKFEGEFIEINEKALLLNIKSIEVKGDKIIITMDKAPGK